jgi:hypothetical protein
MTQADVVFAFVMHSQGAYVAFAKRGGENSARPYVNVFGPSHDPGDARAARIVIEHDGAISIKDAAVATVLGAQPRTSGDTAPSPGGAKWGLATQVIEAKYASPDALAGAIIQAMRDHGGW